MALIAVAGLAPYSAGVGLRHVPTTVRRRTPAPIGSSRLAQFTVKLQLRRLDRDGAVFEIIFDTHDVELDQDLVQETRLVVGETPSPTAEWSGDGVGGHHREGELRFTAASPAKGVATLSIGGLPELGGATWDIGSSR